MNKKTVAQWEADEFNFMSRLQSTDNKELKLNTHNDTLQIHVDDIRRSKYFQK